MSSNDEEGKPPQEEMAKVFRESVKPYSQSLMALHPHLYVSGLYHRASELKALDKIVGQLQAVLQEAKKKKYANLPSILESIKDALGGKPKLSWWNLFMLSVGRALSNAEDRAEHEEQERKSLNQISTMLTEIIRGYKSTDTKLLLQIRLTALDIDSRLVELEKLPKGGAESGNALDYVASEFRLLIRELEQIKTTPQTPRSLDPPSILKYTSKAAQLMQVLSNLNQTNPGSYKSFLQTGLVETLRSHIHIALKSAYFPTRETELSGWGMPQLESFYQLFAYFPESLCEIGIVELCTLLMHTENLFVKETNLDKVRPGIFSSRALIIYAISKNSGFAQLFEHIKAVLKGKKYDPQMSRNMPVCLKDRFKEENDLYHLCGMIKCKNKEYQEIDGGKPMEEVRKECLSRMALLASASSPKDLDAVLKSFLEEEKEIRYFLTQETILEQFIRWRKQGIY